MSCESGCRASSPPAKSYHPTPSPSRVSSGRDSLAARRAFDALGALWEETGQTPEARLKRALWDRLLGLAYGADVGDDALFLQHTYLVVVAKAMAWEAMIGTLPGNAADLLHGAAYSDLGIVGQSEPDFFDWILATEDGARPGHADRAAGGPFPPARHSGRYPESALREPHRPGDPPMTSESITRPTGWLPAWSPKPWTARWSSG